MNIESYSFVLLTAVVGMGVVFFFLFLLSVLMIVIRLLFDDRKPAVVPVTTTASEDGSAGGAELRDEQGVPRWAVAGALAYLSAEEREYAPRAGGWIRGN